MAPFVSATQWTPVLVPAATLLSSLCVPVRIMHAGRKPCIRFRVCSVPLHLLLESMVSTLWLCLQCYSYAIRQRVCPPHGPLAAGGKGPAPGRASRRAMSLEQGTRLFMIAPTGAAVPTTTLFCFSSTRACPSVVMSASNLDAAALKNLTFQYLISNLVASTDSSTSYWGNSVHQRNAPRAARSTATCMNVTLFQEPDRESPCTSMLLE